MYEKQEIPSIVRNLRQFRTIVRYVRPRVVQLYMTERAGNVLVLIQSRLRTYLYRGYYRGHIINYINELANNVPLLNGNQCFLRFFTLVQLNDGWN